jgi:CDP-4-dehydro-6-deoxyglucose reductase
MAVVHLVNQKSFEAPPGVSLLDAASTAGLVLEHSCRSGRCRSCRARVLSGKTVQIGPDLSLGPDERADGWVLTCSTAAATELVLDVPDLGAPAQFPLRTLPCRIDTIEHLAPTVVKVLLRLPPNAEMRYLAGQYVDIIGEAGLRRSYSIANPPDDSGRLELHIRHIPDGAMSAYWFDAAQRDDLLRFEGPRGTFFLRDVAGMDLVFIATGTGIAPIKAMLGVLARVSAEQRPRSVRLLWGGRSLSDIYWLPELPDLPLVFTPVLSRPDSAWAGARGYVQQELLATQNDWRRTVVYACGAMAMIESARAMFEATGLPVRQFHSDAFVSSG